MFHWADRFGVGDVDLPDGGYIEHAVTPDFATVANTTISFVFKVCRCLIHAARMSLFSAWWTATCQRLPSVTRMYELQKLHSSI